MATLGPNSSENFLKRWFRFVSYPFRIIGGRILRSIHMIEQFYIKLYNIYAFISQMLFFILCSRVFHEFDPRDHQHDLDILMALKTLLFYSVFTYFATKTKDIMTANHRNRQSQYWNWNFAEGICRIVIEWAKALIVVICLREQGIYFKPSASYGGITFSYYLCTEKIFVECIQLMCRYFEMGVFDDLEHLYVPLILNIYTTVLSFSLLLNYLITAKFGMFTFISSYFIIYIRLKDTYFNYWKIIKLEKRTFDNFRNATTKELDEFDDVCAVCLNKMSKAKITPCNHFFHPQCLKECLKSSFLCPLCKLHF